MTIGTFTGDHRFLSNFYPAEVGPVYGIGYPTLEHYFQAMKTADRQLQSQISDAPAPGDAKARGRALALRPDWESIKLAVMRFGLRLKFPDLASNRQNVVLSEELLRTGDHLLIEGNNWGDTYWGATLTGSGQNWLGHLLMARRAELRGSHDLGLGEGPS